MWGQSDAQLCPASLLVSPCISTTFFMTLEEALMLVKQILHRLLAFYTSKQLLESACESPHTQTLGFYLFITCFGFFFFKI